MGEISRGLQQLSPACRVFSYLDDIMVFAPREHAAEAQRLVVAALTNHGLTVNQSKTQAWSADREADLPEAIRGLRVDHLKCLGNTAPWLDQQADRIRVHAGTDGAAAVQRAQAFTRRLRDLRGAGLSAEAYLTLLRTYAQGCVTHHLRANLQGNWVEQLDAVVFSALEHLLRGGHLDDLQRLQATMRLTDGGCAIPSAAQTAPAAYAASWALCLHDVAKCLDVSTLEGFRTRCPRTLQALAQAEQALQASGATAGQPMYWASSLLEPRAKLQGVWSKTASGKNRERLLRELPEADRLALRECGGVGAGAFLQPRQPAEPLTTR